MPGRTVTADNEKKKIEIGAVIDFCGAKGFKFTKNQVFRFFGVRQQTGSKWGFTNSYTPNHRGTTQPESTVPTISSAAREQSPPVKRQNPIRNGGRDRKKLKSIIDEMAGDEVDFDASPPPSTPCLSEASSSPTPEEPLTPSKRRIALPRKRLGSRFGGPVKEEGEIEIKSENLDDDVDVEV